MKFLLALKEAFLSEKLKGRFLRSHFSIAFIGFICILISIALFVWLRVHTMNLVHRDIPVTLTLEKLNTGLQKALADLRGWVSIGDRQFVLDRRLTWDEAILPGLDKLSELSKDESNLAIQNKVIKLEQLLKILYVWQWRIEDIAQTKGNYPAMVFLQQYIVPLQRKINSISSGLSDLLEADNKNGDEFVNTLFGYRISFSRSVRMLGLYLATKNSADLQKVYSAKNQSRDLLNRINKNRSALSKEEKSLLYELSNLNSNYNHLLRANLKIYGEKPKNLAVAWLSEYAVPTSRKAETLLKDILKIKVSAEMANAAFINKSIVVAACVLLVFAIIMLVTSYRLAVHNAGKIVDPILVLLEAEKAMAEGKLDADIPINSNDELGELTKNFNLMSNKRRKAEKRLTVAMEDLDRIARQDYLTNLSNRFQFNETIKSVLAHSKRYERRAALLLLDADKFKNVNDTYGHDVGDELIKTVGVRLKKASRASDHVARLGGDEMAIILSEVSDKESAGRYCEKLFQLLDEPYNIKGHSFTMSFSIGVARFPEDGELPEELYKKADLALYAAKDVQGDSYRYFDSSEMSE